MRRRLSSAILWLSITLCVLNVALWISGYWHVFGVGATFNSWPLPGEVWKGRFAAIRLVQGRWLVGWGSNEFHLAHADGIVQGWGRADAERFLKETSQRVSPRFMSYAIETKSNLPPSLGVVGPPDYLLGMRGWFDRSTSYSTTIARTDSRHEIMFPAWLTLIVFIIAPLRHAVRAIIRRRRFAEGCCTKCGYDLRASPGRCPECGAGAEVATAQRV